MKYISVLGSTGSIGAQTLEVIGELNLRPAALAAGSDARKLEEQCRKWRPRLAVLYDGDAARDLKVRLADTPVRISAGMDGLIEAAELDESFAVVTAVVGMVGLRPTIAAARKGKRIALANKETLVSAGELVMRIAAESGAEILPVDSEHSAIFQCLKAGRVEEVKKLILTASGGPFFGKSRKELAGVTVREALDHPNWSMGAKITVDSATLMNKGLEFIEAMRLYSMPPDKIDIIVHRESIIHSMVEYCDGSVIAQMSRPDMRLPIRYALAYPERAGATAAPLGLTKLGALTFAEPDMDTFGCLRLAIGAAKLGGTACAALNGANEAAVDLFLEGKISFTRIEELIEGAMEAHISKGTGLEDIIEADRAARERVFYEQTGKNG